MRLTSSSKESTLEHIVDQLRDGLADPRDLVGGVVASGEEDSLDSGSAEEAGAKEAARTDKELAAGERWKKMEAYRKNRG